MVQHAQHILVQGIRPIAGEAADIDIAVVSPDGVHGLLGLRGHLRQVQQHVAVGFILEQRRIHPDGGTQGLPPEGVGIQGILGDAAGLILDAGGIVQPIPEILAHDGEILLVSL